MPNVLLVFPWYLRDKSNFEKIIHQYEKNGFEIRIYQGIDNRNFNFTVLPNILSELNIADDTKLVVLSNVAEIIFSWFRCYSSLMDDFIYFIDTNDNQFLVNNAENKLFHTLARFDGIEEETIEAKIFININISNYKFQKSFLFFNHNFRYFTPISNINFDKQQIKRQLQKSYILDNQEFTFLLNKTQFTTEKVYLRSSNPSSFKINDEYIRALDDNVYFIGYLLPELYKSGSVKIHEFIKNYFFHLRDFPMSVRERVYESLMIHLSNTMVDFKEKVFFLSLLVLFKVKDNTILKSLMNTLLKDDSWINYHYSILVDTLFYTTKENLTGYLGLLSDRRLVLQRIANFYQLDFFGMGPRDKNIRKIAFHVDQLLGMLHSPSKLTLDYAVHLKNLFPSYEIKIFVEDNYYSIDNEVLSPYHFTSITSKSCIQEHHKYLNRNDIEIFYSDVTKTKKERTEEIVNEIINYNPDVIISTSDLSLARVFLYSFFPFVYLSLGGVNYSTLADVYLHGDKQEVIENDNEKLLNPDLLYDFKWGLSFLSSSIERKRSTYGANATDFLFITVGNRLDAEMSNEFIDIICNFLKKNKSYKWLIVGPGKLRHLEDEYQNLIGHQVILVNYDNDLPSLYRICDAYLNPFRHGGGFSIAWAMYEGLPIIISNQPSDGLVYVGVENSCGSEPTDFLKELESLNNNPDYKLNKQKIMKERIRSFTMENSIQLLIKYCLIAKEHFLMRKQN